METILQVTCPSSGSTPVSYCGKTIRILLLATSVVGNLVWKPMLKSEDIAVLV